jgi:hypothetical protein
VLTAFIHLSILAALLRPCAAKRSAVGGLCITKCAEFSSALHWVQLLLRALQYHSPALRCKAAAAAKGILD